jgi:hypothetical protein
LELWRQHPAPLIGIATGAKSGFDVLDIDIKHQAARAWFRVARPLIPATRTFRTRSGGVHFWFRHADGIRNSESLLAHGVDTRGERGYCIFWYGAGFPCLDHAPIAPWPDWLLARLLQKPEPLPPPPGRPFRSNGARHEERIARLLRRLEAAPEGQRHHTLRATARTVGGLMAAVGLSETAATRLLLDAVLAAGGAAVNQSNALATIRWALQRGRQAPLDGR